jgi:hypothetical protein
VLNRLFVNPYLALALIVGKINDHRFLSEKSLAARSISVLRKERLFCRARLTASSRVRLLLCAKAIKKGIKNREKSKIISFKRNPPPIFF